MSHTGRSDEVEALIARARAEYASGDFRAAEATCAEAIRLRPDAADAHRVMGTIRLFQNLVDDAIASFDRSLRLDPADPRTYKKLAQAFAAQGRLGEADAADRKALELDPRYVGALTHLAGLKRFTSAQDEDLVALEARLAGEQVDEDDRILLLFALAKAYEELDAYDRSFACLREANTLARRGQDWDSATAVGWLGRIREAFSQDLLERLANAGAASDLPVLIVGMPRSGTSLVEQILAAHPAVHGGGERPDLIEIASVLSVVTDDGPAFPESITLAQPETLRALGEGYSLRLRDLAPDAARVTDKTPRNFRYLGLVQLLLPNAKVVHCVRDPVDTCFSCYSLNLVAQPYTFDLVELGEYYRAYADLMTHWHRVLPPGWVLDVRYEELVADLEGVSRRIVAHCGLEWDEACLRFHDAARPVLTASVAQVRRPLYRTSVSRWRRFEPHLGELLAALEAPSAGPETERRLW